MKGLQGGRGTIFPAFELMQNRRSDARGSRSSPRRPEASIITYSAGLDAVNAKECSPSGKRHTLHVCAAAAAYSEAMAE